MAGVEPINPYAREFLHGLRDVGLVDGRDIVIERRSGEGQPERLARVMQEIVASNVDVIVTTGPGVRAAMNATDRIAIVALIDAAVESGVVSSLAHPGGNVTGFGLSTPGAVGKLLQLLKEAAPSITRLAVIAPTQPPGPRAPWRVEIDSAARSMNIDVLWQAVDVPQEYEPAFTTIRRRRANALFLPSTPLNFYHLRRIADLARMQRLPSVHADREYAKVGGLLSYGDDEVDTFRHAAGHVKKIIEGAKPGDLPFEQPTKAELTINLKTAKALGLSIPQSLLVRADQVIQ